MRRLKVSPPPITLHRPVSRVFLQFAQHPFPQPQWHLSPFRPISATHSFSSSVARSKKKNKPDHLAEEEDVDEELPVTEHPGDLSSLEEGIKQSIDKLKEGLSRLRPGGKFNPDALEGLRVKLKKGRRETYPLGSLAQVVPRGRNIMILVGEKDFVKPITSAIQGSRDLNLQVTSDPEKPQQLSIPIPPPTQESRAAVLADATKKGEIASLAVKNSRGDLNKKLRAMTLGKTARPDDINKASKNMEKMVERANEDIKSIVREARLHLQIP